MDNNGAAVSTADEWGSADAGQGLEAARPNTPLAQPRPALASLLVESGVASKEQLDDALVEAQATGERLGEVVVRRGWINEAQLAEVLARQWQLPFAALSTISVDPEAQGLMSQEDAVSLGAWPVGFMAGVPLVAVADPGEARFASVRETLGRDCAFAVTTRRALAQLIEENTAPATGAQVASAAESPEPTATAFEPGQEVIDNVPGSVEADPAPAESCPATPEIESTNGFEPEPAAAFEPEPTARTRWQRRGGAVAFEDEPAQAPETVLPAPVRTVAGDESTPVLEELERLLDRVLEERGLTRDQLVACHQQLEVLREDEARLQESIRTLEAKATREEQHLESMRSKLFGTGDSLTAR